MAEYFAFQAALCFSVAHILVRRGLVNSNALTGSFISLATSAAAFWILLPWFVPLSALWAPAIIYFVVAGFFAPAVGQTLGYLGIERIGVARSAPIVNSAPIFSSLLAVFLRRSVGVPEYYRNESRHHWSHHTFFSQAAWRRAAQARCYLSDSGGTGLR